jgi:hypothetical protein
MYHVPLDGRKIELPVAIEVGPDRHITRQPPLERVKAAAVAERRERTYQCRSGVGRS